MTQQESELREKIKSSFHRMRTRALRGAEVRLDHISEAEADMISLITTLTDTHKREVVEAQENVIDAVIDLFANPPTDTHTEDLHYHTGQIVTMLEECKKHLDELKPQTEEGEQV